MRVSFDDGEIVPLFRFLKQDDILSLHLEFHIAVQDKGPPLYQSSVHEVGDDLHRLKVDGVGGDIEVIDGRALACDKDEAIRVDDFLGDDIVDGSLLDKGKLLLEVREFQVLLYQSLLEERPCHIIPFALMITHIHCLSNTVCL